MWPFRRRQPDLDEALRQVLTAYADLTPKEVKAALSAASGLPKTQLDVGDIVLVMVRDDELSLIPSLLTKVTDCVLENSFCIEAIMSSLVLISTHPGEKGAPEARRFELVDRLRQTLAGDAKIAHGRKERLRGTLGSEGRSAWGSCLPYFGKALSALERANLGEVIDI